MEPSRRPQLQRRPSARSSTQWMEPHRLAVAGGDMGSGALRAVHVIMMVGLAAVELGDTVVTVAVIFGERSES